LKRRKIETHTRPGFYNKLRSDRDSFLQAGHIHNACIFHHQFNQTALDNTYLKTKLITNLIRGQAICTTAKFRHRRSVVPSVELRGPVDSSTISLHCKANIKGSYKSTAKIYNPQGVTGQIYVCIYTKTTLKMYRDP